MQTVSRLEGENVLCNVCGRDEYTVVTETSREVQTASGTYQFHVRLVCCRACGLVYWNPRKTAEELGSYYASVYRAPVILDNLDEGRRQVLQSRMSLLKEHAPERGRLLEIGSGEGFFLQKAITEGFEATGIEPSRSYAEVSRRLVPEATVYTGAFESFQSEKAFDVICSFFVLEHILDPAAFLRKCEELLAPDGLLYLEIPDVGLYPSQHSDMVWHEHTYHFTQAAIKQLLARAGFRVIDVQSPGPSYQFGMAVFARKEPTDSARSEKGENVPDPEAYRTAVKYFEEHFSLLEKYRETLRRELEPVLNEVRNKERRLAVYGTGIYYDYIHEHTDLKPEDISIVLDDNEEKWGKLTRQGLEIKPPASLPESGADIVLIASDCFESKMSENLARWSQEHGRSYSALCLHSRVLESLAESDFKRDAD
ncbi:MAG: methyltransferase domain-containing protein [Pyrinomonadaceae bacterium]|nr:methyltransferase domain-containing protein [Pyrinomonadaceae bacterium]